MEQQQEPRPLGAASLDHPPPFFTTTPPSPAASSSTSFLSAFPSTLHSSAAYPLSAMNKLPEERSRVLVRTLACVLQKLTDVNRKLETPASQLITKFHASRPPSISVANYLERINKYAACSSECLVLALIYIDRLIQQSNFALTSLNIHRVLITAIMLAAKFFDDQYFNNLYYAKVGGVPCKEINSLEVEFLFLTNFSLHVTEDVFFRYFHELMNHAAHAACPSCGTHRSSLTNSGSSSSSSSSGRPHLHGVAAAAGGGGGGGGVMGFSRVPSPVYAQGLMGRASHGGSVSPVVVTPVEGPPSTQQQQQQQQQQQAQFTSYFSFEGAAAGATGGTKTPENPQAAHSSSFPHLQQQLQQQAAAQQQAQAQQRRQVLYAPVPVMHKPAPSHAYFPAVSPDGSGSSFWEHGGGGGVGGGGGGGAAVPVHHQQHYSVPLQMDMTTSTAASARQQHHQRMQGTHHHLASSMHHPSHAHAAHLAVQEQQQRLHQHQQQMQQYNSASSSSSSGVGTTSVGTRAASVCAQSYIHATQVLMHS